MKTITLKTKEALEQEIGEKWRSHGKIIYQLEDWCWHTHLDEYLGNTFKIANSEWNLLTQGIPVLVNDRIYGTITPVMIVEFSEIKFNEALQEFKNTPNKTLIKHLKDLNI